MSRKIDFFDGAQSSTTPTIGNIAAAELVEYANDAAYEAANVGAPTTGNVYYNTTDNAIRYYNGSSWVTINKASDVSYDNATSGLTATDAQAAIDEVEGRVDTNESNISTNTSNIATNTSNISTNAGDITNLEQLSGEGGASAHAPFSGSTIPNSSSTRGALQALETEVELKLDASEKGAVNGVAELDGSGKVPAAQLPSYVDDVLEYADLASFPGTGETGKIYVALDTNKTYRWSGATYIEVSPNDVNSVNGQTGIVSLDTDDISEGATNLYYTEARVSANTNVTANTAKVSADGSIDTHSDVDTSTVAPTDGQALLWNNADSEWQPGDVATGSGEGGINYFPNSTFEDDLSGVSVSDADVTIAQEVANKLRGIASLKVTFGTATDIGDYVAFTLDNIDPQDIGKNLFVSFDYATDAEWGNDEFEIRLRNTATGDEEVISDELLSTGAFTNRSRFTGKNTAFDTTNLGYEVRIYSLVSRAALNSTQILIDRFSVSPDTLVPGAIVTEWQSFTPTGSWTGGITYSGYKRRVGDTAEYRVEIDVTGAITPGATVLTINQPADEQIDGTKIIGTFGQNPVGQFTIRDGSSGTPGDGIHGRVMYNNAGTVRLRPFEDVSTNEGQSNVTNTIPVNLDGSDFIYITWAVPISGWSSGAMLSTTENLFASPRARMYLSANQNVTADLTDVSVQLNTISYDNVGMADTSNNEFVIPSDGVYKLHAQVQVSGSAANEIFFSRILLNGGTAVFYADVASPNAGSTYTFNYGDQISLSKGDTIGLSVDAATDGTYVILGATSRTFLAIEKVIDFSTFSVYGETEYLEVIGSSNTQTVSADTYVDVTGYSLTLGPGEWDIGYNAAVFHDWVSGTPSLTSNVGIFDSSNNLLGNTISACSLTLASNNDNITLQMSNTSRVILTQQTTIKLRIRAGTANTVAIANFLGATNITGSLTDPDNNSKLWARRVK